ncbi:MAG TPA: hypothetical protein VH988_07960 [Thermoanaerobaculia bacterium]|jgi:hypothetical protein|nr:hypothetical protein [Thermoanaerobaculia bacterium]
MAQDQSYSEMLGIWQRLLAALLANAADLGHLETSRAKLAALFSKATDITTQQAALKASKQESSQQIKQIATDGRRLATLLRSGVKEHYGPKAEKLTEFGVQPFRGRKAKDPVVPAPAPAAPAGHQS